MSEESQPPLASTRSELRNLRNHSGATVAELKAFLAEMKGRSPQEMLGMVTGNRLFRAIVQSLILIVAILFVFTVIPYLTRESEPAPEATETAEAAQTPPAAAEEVPEPAVMEAPAGPDALETLGVGEEIKAPPNVNPLESDTGNFLEELD
ncbi:hypothetical protein [Haloferula sp. A504]|uniref:hypothetical protein n=1 Tax=Haloferula sp. A504 TaxID=3373601 RepID=UPI0031C7F806|nr:hypothetical protein [Verrucomicrobiaceae bacterium E54]